MLSEFTLRAVNPKRHLVHALLPFLPEARTYARSVKVREFRALWALRALSYCTRALHAGGLLLCGATIVRQHILTSGTRCLLTCIPSEPPNCNPCMQACHRWWDQLLLHIRATDLKAAEAAGDTSLRTCLAKLPVPDELLLPQIALYVIAG